MLSGVARPRRNDNSPQSSSRTDEKRAVAGGEREEAGEAEEGVAVVVKPQPIAQKDVYAEDRARAESHTRAVPDGGEGGFVGDGAVIDAQFNTTDVAVVVKTDMVTESYYRHYERRVRDAPD